MVSLDLAPPRPSRIRTTIAIALSMAGFVIAGPATVGKTEAYSSRQVSSNRFFENLPRVAYRCRV